MTLEYRDTKLWPIFIRRYNCNVSSLKDRANTNCICTTQHTQIVLICVGALHSHSQVLYLFKGATGLVDCNAPGLVCVENMFKILCAHPFNVHGLTTCQLGMGERKGK
jgi:hypothetical protein